jgi:hypothetical protein
MLTASKGNPTERKYSEETKYWPVGLRCPPSWNSGFDPPPDIDAFLRVLNLVLSMQRPRGGLIPYPRVLPLLQQISAYINCYMAN